MTEDVLVPAPAMSVPTEVNLDERASNSNRSTLVAWHELARARRSNPYLLNEWIHHSEFELRAKSRQRTQRGRPDDRTNRFLLPLPMFTQKVRQ